MEAKSKHFDPRRVKVAAKTGTIWSHLLPWAYIAVMVLIVVIVFGTFWPIMNRNRQLQRNKVSMQQRIETAQTLNRCLQQQDHALQNDCVYIKRMARDVLNVGKPGEVIFQFSEYREEDTKCASPSP
ncbi:MAG: septum formation initiator family protein [bacterium]